MASLPPLATQTDAKAWGISCTDEALARASVRVRDFTGQPVTAVSVTVAGVGPLLRLPVRPVRSITSVTTPDGNAVSYDLGAGGLLEVATQGDVNVTYEGGYVEVPDGLKELVCTIAARLSGLTQSMTQGVTSEQAGSEMQTFGSDAWRATTSLTEAEKSRLRHWFPTYPHLIVQTTG